MTKVTFTPGPWSIRKEHSASAEFVEINGDQIAMLCDGDDKERMANARLIAAAPDMLAALKALVNSLADADQDGMTEFAEEMVAARAALSRAEGRQP